MLGACRNTANEHGAIEDYALSETEKDLTPPIIICDEDSFEIELGADFDLKEYIEVIDNKTKNMRYEIVGELDRYKPGNYPLEIAARDHAGNEARKALTVLVRDKPKKEVPNPSTPAVSTANKTVEPTKLPTPTVLADTSTNQQNVPKTTIKETRPKDKVFLFTEGYTTSLGANPADLACQDYLFSMQHTGYGGVCKILYDDVGNPIGAQTLFH